jgi:hypothetical protein
VLVTLVAGVFSLALFIVPLIVGFGAAAFARGGWWGGNRWRLPRDVPVLVVLAGTSTGGPDVIRDWLRTNDASYR